MRRTERRWLVAALSSSAMLAVASGAQANPQGGAIGAGSAAIVATTPGRVDVNQTSDRLIINWQGFSIGPNEITRFNQPSPSASALNRVTGGDPSQILGQLSANGRILLINPNGVLFGAGSRVDVAGLIATTANLADADYQAGRLNFALPSSLPTASVVNRGTITVAQGGLVALVAPGVSNEGVIQARLGHVSLVSADRFTVDFHGDRLIQFALDDKVTHTVTAPDGVPLAAAVSNSGRIVAQGGMVEMTANVARGVLDRVIDMSGVIEARTARRVGGAIVFDGGEAGTVQVSGQIDATGRHAGQTGGTVRILGERVGLFAGARVDASGDAGGGTVLVGGNQRGQGPERNAQATYVDPNASIKADAITQGNGGTVVVWSDSYTNFSGTISARGGAAAGNGGSVETSSKGALDVSLGRVDASAPAGRAGQWLLDPFDLDITSTTAHVTAAGGTFTASSSGASVDAGAISTALSLGTNVTICASGTGGCTGAAGGQSGNITFQSDGSITMNGATPATLTLIAAGGMAVNGSPTISATGAGALSVSITLGNAGATTGASGSGAYLPAMGLGKGSFTLTSSGGHVFQNGPLTQAAGGDVVTIDLNGHGITLDKANSITGTLSLAHGAGSDVTIKNSTALNLGTFSVTNAGTPLAITAGGPITQTGALTAAGTSSFSAGANAITLTQAANSLTGAVSLSNSGANNVQLTNATATALGSSTVGGNLTVTSSGAITQTAAATVSGTSSFSAGANAITLTQAANSLTGAVSLSNSGANNVQLTNATATVLGGSTVGGNLTVTSGGAISQTGALSVGGTTSLAATAGGSDVLLNTQANNLTGAVSVAGTATNIRDFALRNVNAGATVPVLSTLTGLRNLTLQFDNAGVSLGAFNANGTATITAGGAITQTGAATVAGASSFSAGANAITLTQGANSLGGAITLSNSGSNDVQLTNNTATVLGTPTLGRNLSVTSNGAISVTGAVSLAGSTSFDTTLGGAGGGNISFAGALTGASQSLTLNAGTGGNITLPTVGATGAPLASLTITNAHDVTGSSLVAVNTLTQSAGTGTTNFSGTGVVSSGAVTLTTGSVAGNYAVGSFTVTSRQTIASGTIAGVGGNAAASLANNPGSTGVQTFNGCTFGGCLPQPVPVSQPVVVPQTGQAQAIPGPQSLLTPTNTVAATTTVQSTAAQLSQPAPSDDPNNSQQHGFEVQIPTTNIDWSDVAGELRLKVAPEYDPIAGLFRGDRANR